jgi:hypothetical protein
MKTPQAREARPTLIQHPYTTCAATIVKLFLIRTDQDIYELHRWGISRLLPARRPKKTLGICGVQISAVDVLAVKLGGDGHEHLPGRDAREG